MSWRRSGRLSNCTWRGPPRVHQKAKPEASSSYRWPPIMTSLDLRGRTSAHGTGRPIFIGPWQIGPAPGGEGRARTTPLTAHVGQTSVSPTRGTLPVPISDVVTGKPWTSAGSSCFMAGTPLLRVVVYHLGEPVIMININVDGLRSGRPGRRSRPTVPRPGNHTIPSQKRPPNTCRRPAGGAPHGQSPFRDPAVGHAE